VKIEHNGKAKSSSGLKVLIFLHAPSQIFDLTKKEILKSQIKDLLPMVVKKVGGQPNALKILNAPKTRIAFSLYGAFLLNKSQSNFSI
jgi:hypothetical protein